MKLSEISKAQCEEFDSKTSDFVKNFVRDEDLPHLLDSDENARTRLEDLIRSSHVAIIEGLMEKIISEDHSKIGEEAFSKDYFRVKLEQRAALLTYLKEELELCKKQ